MRRKISFFLALIVATASLPVGAMAASSNSLSQSNVSIKDNMVLLRNTSVSIDDIDTITSGTPVYLQIRPTSEVEVGSSIILTVENGKFNETLTQIDPFVYKSAKDGLTYDEMEAAAADSSYDEVAAEQVKGGNSRQMPYGFRYINSEQIEVYLWPINDTDANSSSSDVSNGTPYYNIALPITTEDSDEGSVTVTIDSNSSNISSGTYTVATVTDSDGSTTASVVSSAVSVTADETYTVPDITIKEDIAGTFDGQTIKIRVNGNWEWSSTGSVVAGINCNSDTVIDGDIDISSNGRTLEFTLADSSAFNSSRTSSIILTGAKVTTDDDDTYGDINITISGGSGITSQTLTVGERQDYGFALTALEEPTTILAGRTPFGDNADMTDFATAEFEFGETTAGTWLTGRKLEFSVPEGVKIVGYEITKTKYIDEFTEGKIIDDGQTLRFDSISSQDDVDIDEDNASYFDIKLYLSCSIDYSGDVTVSVEGVGLEADTLSDLVVAEVVSPVEVSASTTKANIGYKSIETSDIVITESVYGALQDGEDVTITLDDTYSSNLAFDDSNLEIDIDGELEVKNFKVKSGAIVFTVDSESYSSPSTITISGVAVGTTQSIPYGNYKITISGDAIVDNYQEDVDQPSTIVVTSGEPVYDDDYEDYDLFEDEGFDFDDYLQIISDATTLDSEVRVTIGESYMVVDGETIEMDAAAYIQTSSNSTMVPIRFVAIALGVDSDNLEDADSSNNIAWDGTNKVATIIYATSSAQRIIQFTAGSSEMIVDGVSITMDNGVVAEIVDGRMYVPFRALGQALGVSVSWDEDTRTAIFNEA